VATYKVHLTSGHTAHVEDAAQNGQQLLERDRPLKATEIASGDDALIAQGVV
jgi:hypothetical protein